jgi:hypothetical protein
MLNSRRKAISLGFTCAEVRVKGRYKAAETTLSPVPVEQKPAETMATLVHEMAHHRQA